MTTEVFVHVVRSDRGNLKPGLHALFVRPQMTLLEEPTEFLAKMYRDSSSTATVRNNAFALSYWHNFCLGNGEDWLYASLDDLLDYRTALESTISRQTRAYRTASTVDQYLQAVVEFYDYARAKKWYCGDIQKKSVSRSWGTAHSNATGSTIKGSLSHKRVSPVGRKRDDSGTMIKPLAIHELRSLLAAMGPTPGEVSAGESARDRLIVDWAWATGLRVSELLSLNVRQFQRLTFDEAATWSHVPVSVTGKGSKRRTITAPIWLIQETLVYIRGERHSCIANMDRADRPSQLFVAMANSSRAGKGLGVRRVEAMLASAYERAGLTELIEVTDPATGRRSIIDKPSHCVHDLRHTYAVLTYHAEVANGNNEPWKRIQVQLGHASLATTTGTYLQYVDAHNEFRHASLRDLIGLPRK